MPTYEYICTNCKNAWEAQQRMSDDPLDTCPKCGQKTAERQVSLGSGFILKGGGWYSDLYSSGGSGGGGSKTTESSSTTESKPATTESKPAATTESKPAAPSTPSGGTSSS